MASHVNEEKVGEDDGQRTRSSCSGEARSRGVAKSRGGCYNNSNFICSSGGSTQASSDDIVTFSRMLCSEKDGNRTERGSSAASRDSSSDRWRSHAARVLYKAGLRQEARGRISAAIGLYRQALKLDPGLDERSIYIGDHAAGENEEDVLPEDASDEHEELLTETREHTMLTLEGCAPDTKLWTREGERRLSETPLHAVEVGEIDLLPERPEGHCEEEPGEDEGAREHRFNSVNRRSTTSDTVKRTDACGGCTDQRNACGGRIRKGEGEERGEDGKEAERRGQGHALRATGVSAVGDNKLSFPVAPAHKKYQQAAGTQQSCSWEPHESRPFHRGGTAAVRDSDMPLSRSSPAVTSAGVSPGRTGVNGEVAERAFSTHVSAVAAEFTVEATGQTEEGSSALSVEPVSSSQGAVHPSETIGAGCPAASGLSGEAGRNYSSTTQLRRHVGVQTQPPTDEKTRRTQQEGADLRADRSNRCRISPGTAHAQKGLPSSVRESADTQRASGLTAGQGAARAAQGKKDSGSSRGVVDVAAESMAQTAARQEVTSRGSDPPEVEGRSFHSCGNTGRLLLAGNSGPSYQNASVRLHAYGRALEAATPCRTAETVQDHSGVSWLWNLPLDLILSLALYVDAYSLTRLSMSCQLLHDLCGSKNNRCWRAKCLQVFGPRCSAEYHLYSDSWHRMYLHRPRIRMDGIYISRSVYLRRVRDVGRLHLDEKEQEGRRHRRRLQRKREQELSSSSVQWISDLIQTAQSPVLAVTYHRYLRFLPEAEGNRVLVLRTEAEKTVAVQALKAAEQRLQEVSSRSGSSCSFVFSPAGIQNEEARCTSSSVTVDPSGCDPSPGRGSQQLCRSGWTWQWLLPLVAVGQFSFDWQSRRLHVFYNEPRSSCARQPSTSGTCVSGSAARASCYTRRQDTSDIKRNTYPLHGGDAGSLTTALAAGLSAQQNSRRMKSEYSLKVMKSCPEDGRSRHQSTHRAVFELCGGPSGRSNSRLRWISLSISSVTGQQAEGEENTTTHLNINSEHFRPFAFSRVKSFESFF